MRANKLETAVCSMPFCSGPPDFFMYISITTICVPLVCLFINVCACAFSLQVRAINEAGVGVYSEAVPVGKLSHCTT